MIMNRIGYALTVAGAMVLVACGGGGGGGGGGGISPLAIAALGQPAATVAPTGTSGASVTLSGVATYESIPNTSGPLSYSAITPKPIRGAAIEVVGSTGTVLATTTTDAAGAYSVSIPVATSVLVRVKAQLVQTGSGATWDVTIRDNTQSDAIYALETATFSSGTDATVARNVVAPSGWDGTAYTTLRAAAPFAVLDTVYATQAKVLSVAPGIAFPPLRVFWSANNVPASGNPALGQIGTTFFTQLSSGRAIYVLGRANVDTDEYDASVIAHEWGHYYQSAFSRDDSPGGSHSLTDRLDRRLAFSEGWGNAWSGIALNRSNYTDSVGANQSQGSNIDLTAGAASSPGWYREASIQSVLWKLNNQVGFKPIHDTLTSAAFKGALAVTAIHPFSAAFALAAPGNVSTLNALLSAQSISTAPNDFFGAAETNDGGIAGVLPLYRPATPGATTQACVSNQAGADNKILSFVYLRFSVPSAGNYVISVAGATGTDPDFEVYSGRRLASSDGLGVSESATVALPAGESVLVINDFNNSSASTCFNVTIQ